ncbi:DUF5655 domain-containing protein [Feifania hominis]|uniref:DUF5655 domain-containing protein n=1 Tax=Feifania hominis TaxID=2763660 RepID=A0A926HTH3_9FIRM|nr:DUF5655 domain-containing protein [Feifania hominis]MBC8535308.1 hypothetical protein [Feifania hominis]
MLREPSEDLFLFFDKLPAALPLFEALDERIASELGASTRKVQRTQITYKNRYNFACISLPVRRVKGWPEVCIIVTFGLGRRLLSARIAVATEPYPNRWTHHVTVSDTQEIDAELMGWLREAYEFSMSKK